MAVLASPTPPPVEDEEPFRHPALFYRGLDEYLAGTLSFIEEGLAAGDPVAVAVPGSKLEPLRAELGDPAHHIRWLDMTHAGRNPGRILPGVLLAFAGQHGHAARVRIIGEPIWPGRSDIEYPACVQHEALINQAFAGRRVDILCPYDVDGLPAHVVADAERTHPTVIGPGGPRLSVHYAPDHVLSEYNRALPSPTQHPATMVVDIESLSQARAFAVAQAHRADLASHRIDDYELAIGELITNSIEHAHGHCALRVWAEDGHLIAEVHDTGQIDDPLAGRRPPEPEQERGRGLLLVNHLTDLVRMHSTDQGTTIRIYMQR